MKLKDIKKTKTDSPRRILLYGTEGIGKSTYAASFPEAVFISTENGLADIDADAFPECRKAHEVYECVHELQTAQHGYQTLVIDSIDWTEKLMAERICDEGGKSSLADFGFGKGQEALATEMDMLLGMLSDLSREKSMHIVLIAHSSIVRFSDPGVGDYDRYQPSLHKKTAAAVREWATEIFFAAYKAYTKEEEGGFGKKSTKASGVGERFIRTQERPTHIAKSRLDLPYEIPMNLSEFNLFSPANKSHADKQVEEVF